MSSSRQFGTIKLWNEDPENGRITPQDGGPDLTVVLADIESEQHILVGSAVTVMKDGQDRAVEVEVVAEVNKKEPKHGNLTRILVRCGAEAIRGHLDTQAGVAAWSHRRERLTPEVVDN